MLHNREFPPVDTHSLSDSTPDVRSARRRARPRCDTPNNAGANAGEGGSDGGAAAGKRYQRPDARDDAGEGETACKTNSGGAEEGRAAEEKQTAV